jgi:hypothetical protein
MVDETTVNSKSSVLENCCVRCNTACSRMLFVSLLILLTYFNLCHIKCDENGKKLFTALFQLAFTAVSQIRRYFLSYLIIIIIIIIIIGGVGLSPLGTAATSAYCTSPR